MNAWTQSDWIWKEWTWLDAAAILVLLACWFGYSVATGKTLMGRVSLNTHMAEIRRRWMREMVGREMRMTDSSLIGHAINSLTFFASTTLLVIAGVVGVLGAIDPAYNLAGDLRFTVKTSREFFELKMFMVLITLAYGFFAFTWALRQYNYICALIGGAPPRDADRQLRFAYADATAEAISLAALSVNKGLRAYYFTLSSLGWFVHPLVFIAGCLIVTGILIRRQFFSHTAEVVRKLPV